MKIQSFGGYEIHTSAAEEEPGQWKISAEVICKTPLPSGVTAVSGMMKKGFKTEADAEAAALQWGKEEIDKLKP